MVSRMRKSYRFKLRFDLLDDGRWRVTCRGHLLGLNEDIRMLEPTDHSRAAQSFYVLYHHIGKAV